jgi:hypothetical protein
MQQFLRFIACRLNTAFMFWASSCPSSGAYQLQQQPLVLLLERVGSSAVGRGWASRHK